MEVCKNNASGQYFIYIRETGAEEALLVTPNAQIKSLKITLFANLEEYAEAHLLESKMVTAEQIRRFHEYKENRSADVTEDLDHYFDQLSPYEQDLFIKKLEKIVEKNQIKT
ncbi:MAG: hypothetical protein FP814_10050 [Desulfobacterium sp.]|nr:hypothetical protein [Desulfobacterium sp.]